eukprot:scaffold8363_cov58-Attheya_sp.AAC.2
MLQCQLSAPNVGNGNGTSFDSSKAGSVPFSPSALKEYATDHFNKRYTFYQGTTTVLPNLIGPINYKLQISCKEDDHLDLFSKVYMPLSQVLTQHGVQLSLACEFSLKKGKEKPEAKFGKLYYGDDVRNLAVYGRQRFLDGIRDPVYAAGFQSTLVVAQILDDMQRVPTTHGVILTAGRAFFVLVVPPQQTRKRSVAATEHTPLCTDGSPQFPAPDGNALPDGDIHTLMRDTASGIYISHAFMLDDPTFLRRLAGFMVESKKVQENEALSRSLAMGVHNSLQGTFCEGSEQKYVPSPRGSGSGSRRSGESHSMPPPASTPPESGSPPKSAQDCNIDIMPWQELEETLDTPLRVLTTTLGRERAGRVVVIPWKGRDVVVKVLSIEKGEKGHEDIQAFTTEVEAYRVAGAAGLWGVAVPRPMFIATRDGGDEPGMRALGMEEGHELPHVSGWSPLMFSQARDCVMRLYQAGVRHLDVHARNFVMLHHPPGNSVATIDLEYFLAEGKPMLPEWIWGR